MNIKILVFLCALTNYSFSQTNKSNIPLEYQISEVLENDSIKGSYTIKKFYKDSLISVVNYKNYEPYKEVFRNRKHIPFNIPLFDSSGFFVNISNGSFDKKSNKHNFAYTITNYSNFNKLGLSLYFYNIYENKGFFVNEIRLNMNVENKLKTYEIKNKTDTFKLYSIDDNLLLKWDYSDLFWIVIYFDRKSKMVSNKRCKFENIIEQNITLFNNKIIENDIKFEDALLEIEKNIINLYCELFKVSYNKPSDW